MESSWDLLRLFAVLAETAANSCFAENGVTLMEASTKLIDEMIVIEVGVKVVYEDSKQGALGRSRKSSAKSGVSLTRGYA